MTPRERFPGAVASATAASGRPAGRYLLVSVAKRLYPLGARLPGMEQRRLHAPKECNWP